MTLARLKEKANQANKTISNLVYEMPITDLSLMALGDGKSR